MAGLCGVAALGPHRTGQNTQEDPIGIAGGLNLYGYANGDPINFSDPFGLKACPPLCDSPNFRNDNFLTASDLGIDQAFGAVGDFARNFVDMVKANTIGADKYFHCKANCQAARRGPIGSGIAELLSDLREWTDVHLQGAHPDSSIADQDANQLGREGGANSTLPCEEVCEVKRPRGLDQRH